MVSCSKCGHEFLCDREKLMSKKPFARAKGISDDNFGKDRGAVFQSSVMETGLIQVVCLGASLLIGAGCVWIFYNASTEMDGTSFLSLLLQPQQKAFALFFACLAGTLMAFSGRRHKAVFIVLGLLLAGGIASLPYVYPVKVNPSLLGGSGSGQAPEDEVPQDNAGSMVLPPDTIQKASVQNYGEGDLRPLITALARKPAARARPHPRRRPAERRPRTPLFHRATDRSVFRVSCVLLLRAFERESAELVAAVIVHQRLRHPLGGDLAAGDEPMFYDRKGTGGGLFVITPTPITFKEFVDVVSRLGEVTLEDKERSFVEVILNRDKFEARPASAALQDERHQYFVLANLKELSSLDIRRVIAAAKRLAAVKPDKLRHEVSSRLVELLKEPWGRDAEYVTALASALVVWAEEQDAEAQRVVYYVTEELKKADCEVPSSLLRFLLRGPEKENAFGMLLSEWKKDPQRWEDECKAIGPTGEAAVIQVLNEADDFVLKRSAARILGEIGTEPSLAALKELIHDADNELRLCAELSVSLIEKRLGKGASPAMQ